MQPPESSVVGHLPPPTRALSCVPKVLSEASTACRPLMRPSLPSLVASMSRTRRAEAWLRSALSSTAICALPPGLSAHCSNALLPNKQQKLECYVPVQHQLASLLWQSLHAYEHAAVSLDSGPSVSMVQRVCQLQQQLQVPWTCDCAMQMPCYSLLPLLVQLKHHQSQPLTCRFPAWPPRDP